MPTTMDWLVIPYAPCRGRCPHRPARRTIVHHARMHQRFRSHAPVNATRYRRDDVDIVPYKHGWTASFCWRVGMSSDTVRHKASVRHPLWGGDGGLRLCREFRHLRMAVWDAKGFRPLRRAGVSLAAASGYFAPCAARPGLCPWTPRFFEKNRVKLFIFSPIAARRRFCNTPYFSATLSLCHSLSKQKGGRNHCGKRYTKRIKKSYWPTVPA